MTILYFQWLRLWKTDRRMEALRGRKGRKFKGINSYDRQWQITKAHQKRLIDCVLWEQYTKRMSKPFLRLGEYERRILLSVGPEPSVIPNRPPRPGKQAYESHHKAITRLRQIGLIDFGKQRVDTEWHPNFWRHSPRRSYPRGYVYRREIYLTPFGQVVLSRIRQRLESGKPIKWRRNLPKLLQPGSHLLQGFDRFKSALLPQEWPENRNLPSIPPKYVESHWTQDFKRKSVFSYLLLAQCSILKHAPDNCYVKSFDSEGNSHTSLS